MKLIAESKVENAELLKEDFDPNKPQTLKLRGVFMQAEQKNENSRTYQVEELEKETNRFKTEMIDTGRALAELEHPETITINPERVCARITDLVQDGNDFIGEAVVLMTDEKHGIKGGVVRNDDKSDELCICTEHYSDDIQSDDWKLLNEVV